MQVILELYLVFGSEKMGTVFNIQKFSVNDGPGIRTTVFLKGCPLSCLWCHNPESKSAHAEVLFDSNKCIGCKECARLCPNGCHTFDDDKMLHLYNRKGCVACGECCGVCYADSLELAGKEQTVQEVIEEVMKDKVFYDNSGGGITLSGGEPMLQFEFTLELLKEAKKQGLHTCIETCGFARPEQYREIAEFIDIFLFDYKETDPLLHRKFTGVTNELILENLKMLDSMGADIVLRCPIIPTLNDRKEHFSGIASLANSLKNVKEINIEPYHPLGASKAERLDKEYPLSELTFPENETVEQWISFISSLTDVPVKKA